MDPKTHPYVSTGLKENKFGLSRTDALATYALAKSLPNVDPIGMDCHIGSQLTKLSPFLEALDKLKIFYGQLLEMGIKIKYLDLGGGLGITYNEEEPPHPEELGKAAGGKDAAGPRSSDTASGRSGLSSSSFGRVPGR